jgi:hypothetical protein
MGGWVSAAVGRIEALTGVDGSTPPDQAMIYGPLPNASTGLRGEVATYVQAEESSGETGPPVTNLNATPAPPFLISLGKFFLNNIDTIYTNYVEYLDDTPGSRASPADSPSADGVAPVPDSTAAIVQAGPAFGWFGVGWTSAMTTGGSGMAPSQGLSSPGEGALRTEGGADDQVQPASITAGEIPLDILLSDPVSPTEDVSMGLQQYAELIPGAESSLALIATLWSVPSDPRWEPSDGGDPSSEREESVPSSASPPPWATFVIGLDESFEQDRDACGRSLSDEGQKDSEGVGDAAEERLEWRCPIIPASAERGPFDRATPSPKNDRNRPLPSRLSWDAEWVARPRPEDASPHDAGDGQPRTEGALPLGWAASGSAVFVGWLWARRRLRPGGGPGGSRREDHRRSRWGRSEEEGG